MVAATAAVALPAAPSISRADVLKEAVICHGAN